MSCFRLSHSSILANTTGVDSPCAVLNNSNPAAPCCPFIGSFGTGNLCLNDFLCWESSPPAGGSGYLTSSCTDETYQSGECTPHCVDQPVPDVVYNFTTGKWHGCGSSPTEGVMCSNPTNETFEAPAPDVLTSLARAASSSTSAAAAASSSPTLVTTTVVKTISSIIISSTTLSALQPQVTASGASLPSSHVGPGAAAGIGVGTAIGILAVGLLLIWLFYHRRLKQRTANTSRAVQKTISPREKSGISSKDPTGPWRLETRHEMNTEWNDPVAELAEART